MRQGLQDKLFEKYPKLFHQKDLPMSQTCMCWGIDTGDGWYDLIDKMCADIMDYCTRENKTIPSFIQMKEKFGSLRAYVEYSDDAIDKIVSKAEDVSYKTCELCSNPGKPNKNGWITTLCKECRERREAEK